VTDHLVNLAWGYDRVLLVAARLREASQLVKDPCT